MDDKSFIAHLVRRPESYLRCWTWRQTEAAAKLPLCDSVLHLGHVVVCDANHATLASSILFRDFDFEVLTALTAVADRGARNLRIRRSDATVRQIPEEIPDFHVGHDRQLAYIQIVAVVHLSGMSAHLEPEKSGIGMTQQKQFGIWHRVIK